MKALLRMALAGMPNICSRMIGAERSRRAVNEHSSSSSSSWGQLVCPSVCNSVQHSRCRGS